MKQAEKNNDFSNLLEKHQELLEIMVRSYNEYAHLHTQQIFYGTDETVSLAQIQVLESILRGKDNNMKRLAADLGITKGSLTKNIKKLEERKLVKRYKQPENRKEVYVEITEQGARLYARYQEYIFNKLFKKIYNKFDSISPEDITLLKEIFLLVNNFMEGKKTGKDLDD
ncbi:MAG: winged helix-turn-helix transcriptional regulator [bacterium]|nr:winged helix-turn-helix transcriptional regulator [bacterium]